MTRGNPLRRSAFRLGVRNAVSSTAAENRVFAERPISPNLSILKVSLPVATLMRDPQTTRDFAGLNSISQQIASKPGGAPLYVAVCIVAFRNTADVVRCLEALSASQHTAFQVVICENGGPASYGALRDAVSPRLPGGQSVLILRDDANGGFAAGINRCMQASPEADAWWLLNPDTIPAADALAKMCDLLEHGDCDAVGCTLATPDGSIESRGGKWRPSLARAVSLVHPQSGEVDYISGASLLVSRRFVEGAGYMREDYFLYGEEVEWCLRARREGLRLQIATSAVVVHAQGTSTGSVSEVARRGRMPVYLDERNKLLITRDLSPFLLPIVIPATLILLALRFGKRGAWSQLGFALEGWRAGLADERGKPSWF